MSRRLFVKSLVSGAGLAGLSGLVDPVSCAGPCGAGASEWLPSYARNQQYRSLKQSSHDVTGGNADAWGIKAGDTKEIFNADRGRESSRTSGSRSAAGTALHLKELVLRAYWDGRDKPSIETPIGDFFGLNLGDYVLYESEYLACSPGQSLNCYFAMPYRKGARLTVTNESARDVGAFYSNIDYLEADALPADALYFHAQYRQGTPNVAQQLVGRQERRWRDQLRLLRDPRSRAPDGRHARRGAERRGVVG